MGDAKAVGRIGGKALAWFIAASLVSLPLWAILIGAGFAVLGTSVFRLLLEARDPLFLAYTTTSSEAAYPKPMDGVGRFGVNDKAGSFVLPLGDSFNLDVSMLYPSFAALFIAQAVAGDDVLQLGQAVRGGRRRDYAIVGEYLSFERYGLAFARGDAAFAELVEGKLRELAAAKELKRAYEKRFVRTLPNGERLGLPMGAELRRLFEILGQPPE